MSNRVPLNAISLFGVNHTPAPFKTLICLQNTQNCFFSVVPATDGVSTTTFSPSNGHERTAAVLLQTQLLFLTTVNIFKLVLVVAVVCTMWRR